MAPIGLLENEPKEFNAGSLKKTANSHAYLHNYNGIFSNLSATKAYWSWFMFLPSDIPGGDFSGVIFNCPQQLVICPGSTRGRYFSPTSIEYFGEYLKHHGYVRVNIQLSVNSPCSSTGDYYAFHVHMLKPGWFHFLVVYDSSKNNANDYLIIYANGTALNPLFVRNTLKKDAPLHITKKQSIYDTLFDRMQSSDDVTLGYCLDEIAFGFHDGTINSNDFRDPVTGLPKDLSPLNPVDWFRFEKSSNLAFNSGSNPHRATVSGPFAQSDNVPK